MTGTKAVRINISSMTPDDRMLVATEILATFLRAIVGEAVVAALPSGTNRGLPDVEDKFPATMGPTMAAQYVGIGVNSMRDLLRTDAIPHRRQGRNYIVRRDALDEWMRSEENIRRHPSGGAPRP